MNIYNNAKIVYTPNGYKAGKLYAVKGADATLVRGVTAERQNASGATQTMGVNVPLIDYSGAGDCPVINVILQDTYTIAIPSDANRVTYYKEDGTTSQVAVTPSSNYTPLVGRYKSIVVDYNDAPPIPYNFDVESSNWADKGITDQESFESELGVTVGAFAITGNKIEAEILTISSNAINLKTRNITNVNYITFASLQNLSLGINQITIFNPTLPLPSSLQILGLDNNQIATAGYTASEPWATAQPAFTSICQINFNSNLDSVSGTNLETILLTKNTTINP